MNKLKAYLDIFRHSRYDAAFENIVFFCKSVVCLNDSKFIGEIPYAVKKNSELSLKDNINIA